MKKKHMAWITICCLIALLYGGYWLNTRDAYRAIHYFSGRESCEMALGTICGLFPYVDTMLLSEQTLTKEDIRRLHHLAEKLHSLVLIDCSTEDSFPEFPSLNALTLDYGGIPDSDLRRNPPIKTEILLKLLQSAQLQNVRFTAVQTSALYELPKRLKSLKIADSPITDEDFLKIPDISNLKALELIKLPNLSEVVLRRIALECSELESLNVAEVPLTDADVALFSQNRRLHHLRLRSSLITKQSLNHLPPELRHLDITNTSISSAEMESWLLSTDLKQLRTVQVGRLALSPELIEACKTKGIEILQE